jgi:anti-sigma28 factor (negative regulator of flagellin synthesis)
MTIINSTNLPKSNIQSIQDAKKNNQIKNKTNILSKKPDSISKLHKKAFDIIKNTKNVNQEKIDKIKSQIAKGKYEVNTSKILDAFLKDQIKDDISLEMHRKNL